MPRKVFDHLLAQKITRRQFFQFAGVAALSLFGVFRIISELKSHAAGTPIGFEPESGTETAPLTEVAITSASAGQAIKFGSGSFTRPTGAGIYAIEDLVVGNDLQAAADKVATMAAAPDGSRTLTLPTGVFQSQGFAKSQNYLGFLIPTGVSLVGSGPQTIIRVAPNTITQQQVDSWARVGVTSGTTIQLDVILFLKGTGTRMAQFCVQGTVQNDPSTGKPVCYNGMSVYHMTDPLVEDVLVTGIPGSLNSPPGETFSINVFSGSGAVLKRVEVDGRDTSGTQPTTGVGGIKVAACGIGFNSTVNVEMHDCYTHHTGYSHGVSFWQTNGGKTWNHHSEYNGTGTANGGGGGTAGDGLNHEKSRNIIHYSPRLGNNSLAELRYYAIPLSSSDPYSGDTSGHELHDLVLTDGGHLDIRIDNTQSTAGVVLTNCPTPNFI